MLSFSFPTSLEGLILQFFPLPTSLCLCLLCVFVPIFLVSSQEFIEYIHRRSLRFFSENPGLPEKCQPKHRRRIQEQLRKEQHRMGQSSTHFESPRFGSRKGSAVAYASSSEGMGPSKGFPTASRILDMSSSSHVDDRTGYAHVPQVATGADSRYQNRPSVASSPSRSGQSTGRGTVTVVPGGNRPVVSGRSMLSKIPSPVLSPTSAPLPRKCVSFPQKFLPTPSLHGAAQRQTRMSCDLGTLCVCVCVCV